MPGDGPFEIAACEPDHIHVESSTISNPIQTNKQPNQGDLPQSAASVNTWAGRRAGEREKRPGRIWWRSLGAFVLRHTQ